MTMQSTRNHRLVDQPEMAVRADRDGELIAGWCLTAALLLMLVVA